jgi:hypothetical protein
MILASGDRSVDWSRITGNAMRRMMMMRVCESVILRQDDDDSFKIAMASLLELRQKDLVWDKLKML